MIGHTDEKNSECKVAPILKAYKDVEMALNNNYADFIFERFEEYYGDTCQVDKQINDCKICGAKLIFSHSADFKNLMMQESARCPDCGSGNKKLIHILN